MLITSRLRLIAPRSANTLLLIMLLLYTPRLHAQVFDLKKIETSLNVSFRGLSVVDDSVAWVSGAGGTVGCTKDGGISWRFQQLPTFEKSDFRSIYAFSRQRVILVNAGSPATALLTENGGKDWRVIYTNVHPDGFVDGIDFWNNKDGIIYGDPIDGTMLLLSTSDGGSTWEELPVRPHLEFGEASFAASGTGIRCLNKNDVFICTGGKISRLWISSDRGKHWMSRPTPISQGEPSTGIFSLTRSGNRVIIVGGDYKNDSLATKNNFYSDDNGLNWIAPVRSTNGYRECVEVFPAKTLLAVGPTGIDVSGDDGVTWKSLSDKRGLHVLRRARQGTLVIAAGGNGQLYIIKRK